VGVLLLAIVFIGVVFTLLYGAAALVAHAWTNRFAPRIPAQELAPPAASTVVAEAEAWLRSHPPGSDPTTSPVN